MSLQFQTLTVSIFRFQTLTVSVTVSLPQKFFVFLSSLDLISRNLSMIFAHFQTKRDFYQGGQNPSVEGPTQGLGRGGGGFGTSSIYVKRGPET